MPKLSMDWASQFFTGPDGLWEEARLKRVRNHVRSHFETAILIDDVAHDRLTTKRFHRAPLIAYAAGKHELEYIMSENVFRDVVCDRMPWRSVLQTLMTAGFLNRGASGLLVARTFPEPLGWARVVSIKPEILKYRTTAEDSEAARDPWGTKRGR